MVKDIFTLAFEYQNKLQPLTKTAVKEKMNHGRIGKNLEKTKADYAKYKKLFKDLFYRCGFEHEYIFDWTI